MLAFHGCVNTAAHREYFIATRISSFIVLGESHPCAVFSLRPTLCRLHVDGLSTHRPAQDKKFRDVLRIAYNCYWREISDYSRVLKLSLYIVLNLFIMEQNRYYIYIMKSRFEIFSFENARYDSHRKKTVSRARVLSFSIHFNFPLIALSTW